MATDFRSIEQKLCTDMEYRERFLADAPAVLKNEGLILTDAMTAQLRKSVAELTGPNAVVAGSNLGAVAHEDFIGISIGKRF